MTSLPDNEPQPMRSPWSFMGSICLHAWVLAWVALSPALPPPAKSLYEREIQPYEKHICLVQTERPSAQCHAARSQTRRRARCARRAKFEQNMVAGPGTRRARRS